MVCSVSLQQITQCVHYINDRFSEISSEKADICVLYASVPILKHGQSFELHTALEYVRLRARVLCVSA